MDRLKIGGYIAFLRKKQNLTQKELADKLHISFQAVSKWETGESLPDTGLLLELCDILQTSADKLLHGGSVALSERRLLRLEEVIQGFENLESIGKLFGEHSSFYTGMVEGINQSMNLDLLAMLKDPRQREVLYAEVLIQGILSGYRVDREEVEAGFQNRKMVETIGKYMEKMD